MVDVILTSSPLHVRFPQPSYAMTSYSADCLPWTASPRIQQKPLGQARLAPSALHWDLKGVCLLDGVTMDTDCLYEIAHYSKMACTAHAVRCRCRAVMHVTHVHAMPPKPHDLAPWWLMG